MISKTPTNPRNHSPVLKKRFTPTVNKSFTCYKEKSLSKHQRAYSLDKNKENTIRRSKNRSLKFTIKYQNPAKEANLDHVKFEMDNGNYDKAKEILSQITRPESETLEFIYSRAVCFMHLKQFNYAIEDFLTVVDSDPIFDKQLYIALYMCFVSTSQTALALKYLSQGIRKFPNFLQGFMLRGQLFMKSKQYEKALKDFKKVLSLDKQHHSALLLAAEAFMHIKDYENAIKILASAVAKPETIRRGLILRSKIHYKLEKYDDALADLDRVLDHWPEEILAYYYKGKINYEVKNYSEAALCFEQAVKGLENPEIINSSVFYLASIKIKEKDFYGALHTFERGIQSCATGSQKTLHLYTEGVICLMKRKLDEGIVIFNGLVKSNEPVLKEFMGNCFENLGFAYFSQGKYEKAGSMFAKAKKHCKVDKSSEFNLLLCEAVMCSIHKNDSKAMKVLKICKKIFPKNPMPELCRACILMNQSFKSEESLHMLIKSELLIDTIYKSRDPESEILFYRSLMKFCLKNYEFALENAKKAVEKADENVPKNYILRGFCHAMLKKYEEAAQDFAIALQLDENLKEIYIFKGISAYLQDDLQLAFDDFLVVSKKYPKDMQLQLKVARFLLIIGSFTDSLAILDEKFLQSPSSEILLLRARNYLSLQDFAKASDSLKLVPKSDFLSKASETDKEIIDFLIKLKSDNSSISNTMKFCNKLKDANGSIFNKKYLYWFIGILLFYNKEFTAASSYFQAVLELLHDEEPELFADSITIEEENCEILYNLALCNLTAGKEEAGSHALMIFEELAEVLNTKHRGQLLFLSALIELTQKNKHKAEKLLKDALKCDSETVNPFLNGQSTTVLPLHTSSDFASLFPLVPLTFDNYPTVYIRPAIILPRIELDIPLKSVLDIVTSMFSISKITPRPEAPWLNRNKGSIQFTENIIEVTCDIIDTEKNSVAENPEPCENTEENEEKKSVVLVGKTVNSQKIYRVKSFESVESVEKEVEVEEVCDDLQKKIRLLCKD